MNLARWLRPLAARLNRKPARRAPHRPAFRPRVEGLEDRIVPAVFTVTSTADGGSGSLRQAILDANTTGTGTPANPDLIQFAIPASDPGHVYYRDDGVAGQVSPANIVRVPTLALDGVTPITSDSQLTDPAVVGVGNTIDPGWVHSWWRIQPTSALDPISEPLTIDGYTEPGTQKNTLPKGDNAVLGIEIDGNRIAPGVWLAGLTITADQSTVQGLDIHGFRSLSSGGGPSMGIWVRGGTNDHIQGNFIGTDISGTAAPDGLPDYTSFVVNGPLTYGVHVSDGARNNWIGTNGDGTGDPGERNIISATGVGVPLRGDSVNTAVVGGFSVPAGGSSNSNIVAGNYIGTDTTGTKPLGNWTGIATVSGANHDRIGANSTDADTSGEGNLISGNTFGVTFAGGALGIAAEQDGLVAGNLIGPDVNGQELDWTANGRPYKGNILAGVGVAEDSSNITIGGTSRTVANTIAGNTGPGVWLPAFQGEYATGIRVQGNSIYDNDGLGIDLGGVYPLPGPDGVTLNDSAGHTGPNHFQNFPVLLSAAATGTSTAVVGTLTGPAGGTYRIEFFANSQPGHPNTNNPGDPNLYGEGETFLGARTVAIGADGTAYILATDLVPIPTGGTYLTATATNEATGDTSEFSATLPVPAAGGGITLHATTQQAADDIVAAVNGMSPPALPVTVTVDLGGGNFTGITASPPANVTLVFENGTFNGHSPALTVTSGTVLVLHSLLQNTTDAPTILVTGGHLTLRDDVIQESTGFAQVAVRVTGGAVDLGTVGDPGGNILNVNGDGTLIADTGTSPVSAIGNTWQTNSAPLTSPAAIAALVSGPVVVKANPVVAVTGGSFIYDGQPHPAAGTVTGVNGESLGTPTFTYWYTDDGGNVVTSTSPPTEPGYYTVTATFPGNADYNLATATATLAIVFEAHTLTDLSKAFHAGRTIPIKIELLDADGNDNSSSGIALTALRLERVNADGSVTQVALQDAGGSNPDNLFRYDASLGGYVFNLSTKGLSAGSYNFYWLDDADDAEHELSFTLI